MTWSVRRKRVKAIGLVLSFMLLALWVFSVSLWSTYQSPGSDWGIVIAVGGIWFADSHVGYDPGWTCKPFLSQLRFKARNMPWTKFAHSCLGFGLPGKHVRGMRRTLHIPVWLLVVATGFPAAIL